MKTEGVCWNRDLRICAGFDGSGWVLGHKLIANFMARGNCRGQFYDSRCLKMELFFKVVVVVFSSATRVQGE